MKKYKRQPVKASTKPAPKKRIIKASEADKPVVMYFEHDKVYEGDINDIYSTILELCQDKNTNEWFMNYLNQFGDPFDFDGTPEDTAETFAEWVRQSYNDADFDGENFYEEHTEDGTTMELFLKSDEAVEGSVQRRAKKSVKASNRPAPRRSIKADEYYPENYADMGYEGLDDALQALYNLRRNAEDLLNRVTDTMDNFGIQSTYVSDNNAVLEMFTGPDDAIAFAEVVGEIADTVAQCERDIYDALEFTTG